ncbi:S-methyl-5-thioribose-1-phosphate isomerase [Candidatus Woesearchaeota archaeon]|nr:S-methyl-5-thioribose-1-phosphate isomerase [Candidatus Woesearchaeota archaeon]
MKVNGKGYRTVWIEDGAVKLINQHIIPERFEIFSCKNYKETAEAIRTMIVRGAGAIGAAAGYAMAQAFLHDENISKAAEFIKDTRPTAQNLFYAVDKVLKASSKEEALKTAEDIADEDAEACRKIGEHGEKLIKDNAGILTHCNAGWLAFVDWGSALSPIYAARRKGKNVFVFSDETRPRLQGARLTAWELSNEDVPHAVIADNAAGYYMKKGDIDMVITGADRIAANGDTANKIGTYEKAVLAKENSIPFYIAAPTSTIDLDCPSGDNIPIEERDEKEVLEIKGLRLSPEKSHAKNPAFDVTPAKYIKGIITEKGIIRPDEKEIRKVRLSKS